MRIDHAGGGTRAEYGSRQGPHQGDQFWITVTQQARMFSFGVATIEPDRWLDGGDQ
jgi:hypothetical protein